jgi:hypothetical protein
MVKGASRRGKPKPPSYVERAEQYGLYLVRFDIGMNAFGRGDYDSVVGIRGSILFVPDESEGQSDEEHVGSVDGFLLKRSLLLEEGGSFFEECDAHSQTVIDYALALFDPDTNELREDVDRALGGVAELDVLILDLIEVVPEHRGHDADVGKVRDGRMTDPDAATVVR